VDGLPRQQMLFDIGSADERLKIGFCPKDRCASKTSEGWSNDIAWPPTPHCCCVSCWDEASTDSTHNVCLDCPFRDDYSVDEECEECEE